MKTQTPQLSDWSMPESTSSQRRDTSIIMSKKKNNLINDIQPNNQQEKKWNLVKYCSLNVPYLCGILLGVLSSGLILAVIITLWLTSGNKKTTTTVAPVQLRWNSAGITLLGTTGVAGSAANQTDLPYGLAFDSLGALYVADYNNNRVQKIITGTSIGLTVAGQADTTSGNGSYYLSTPLHMAFDSNNNMYVSDRGNIRVQFFTRGNLSGTTVAGVTDSSGSASNQLHWPSAIVYDSNTGNLYIADASNHRVMKYPQGASSGIVVAGGNGPGLGTSQLYQPFGLYFDTFSNSFFIPNRLAHNIVRWTLGDSNWILIAGSSTGIPGNDSTSFDEPLGITLDRMGNIYVADSNNHRIQFFLYGQSVATTIAGITGVFGTSSTMLNNPRWVILDNQLNLYVSDSGNNRVLMFKRY